MQGSLNPGRGRDAAPSKRLRATNAVAREQMWRHMNKYRQPQKMERSRYRAVWRRFCIFLWNLPGKENGAPPHAKRAANQKTYGRR